MELRENAIASGGDDTPAMIRDHRRNCGHIRLKVRKRGNFVFCHEPAIADHVCGKDGGEATFDRLHRLS
ncbi:MAG: hypothetical protein EXQ92_06540 [Alphaproteobacteria bacterium]|nr:hypothetical protein [Alphaproteobacteria bacterium]